MPKLKKIRHKPGAGDHVVTEQGEILRQQQQPAKGVSDEQHDGQRRKNPTHPARVKVQQPKLAGPGLRENDAGDEKTGNYEEDVDADEAPRNKSRAGVISHHQQDRHGAQAVNVRAIERRIAAR